MRALDIYKQDQSPDISGILFLSLNFFFLFFSASNCRCNSVCQPVTERNEGGGGDHFCN